MINSPEMHLCIKRSQKKLSTKIYLFLATKSFGQIHHKYKTVHNKRSTQWLCAIFGTEPRHGITHNTSKIQLKSICRFWTTTDLSLIVFNFFMQKLVAKSRVMLYKSCKVIHKETKKLSLYFFWFSKIHPKAYTT
jgi:hypothetical protein